MFDLEAFKKWDRQVDHGNDAIIEGAIAEIERLRAGLQMIAEFYSGNPHEDTECQAMAEATLKETSR